MSLTELLAADVDRRLPGRRAMKIALGIIAAVILVAVIVWARFVSGASAAPVPNTLSVAIQPESTTRESSSGPAAMPTAAPASASVAAAQLPASTQVLPELGSSSAVEPSVDPAWLDRTTATTRIPRRALQAYAGADLELEREQPSCHLGWNTLAAIGKIESNHGHELTDAGYSTSPILGPSVGAGLHAEGPMQFMPSTWTKWGADGNGDGAEDPNQMDDAALAAGRYLCSYGDLGTPDGWRSAVYGYNHLDSYVAAVTAQASAYGRAAS